MKKSELLTQKDEEILKLKEKHATTPEGLLFQERNEELKQSNEQLNKTLAMSEAKVESQDMIIKKNLKELETKDREIQEDHEKIKNLEAAYEEMKKKLAEQEQMLAKREAQLMT